MCTFYVSMVYLLTFCNLVSLNPRGGAGGDIYNNRNLNLMPECCNNNVTKYCFSNENYPIEIVTELLKDMPNLSGINGDNYDSTHQFSDRLGDSNSCGDNNGKLIYYIFDNDDNTRVVVQLENKLTQQFTIKTDCNSEKENIRRHFPQLIIKMRKISCEFVYRYYDFIVLSNKSNTDNNYKLEMINAKLPVCCSCRYNKK